MIETFDITSDSTQISMYAGMLITSFAFAEFSTGVIWGRISDRIGRKPVLIMGLVGTALSMVLFGFATSLPTAIVARALGGLLNGNVGVLQTTVAELVTSKEHQPRAYSIMPFVWCLGSIIGPAMGGALATPCESYPWLFPRDTIFARHPFLLPNLVCVGVLLLGITIGVLFLDETHADLKSRRDYGRNLGLRIVGKITGSDAIFSAESKTGNCSVGEGAHLIENDAPPGYRSTQGSPRLSTATGISPATKEGDIELAYPRLSGKPSAKTFNRQVVLVIIGYGILA
jgi:MFS family permease